MSQLNFDASNVEPAGNFEPVPAGWYTGRIVNSEMRPTQKGDGSYLNLEIELLDEGYAGRRVFDRLNLDNPNPTAVEIAYQQLSAICHATGVVQVQQSEQLHNIPMAVKVTVRPATEQYDANNDVKGYKALEGGGAPPQQPAPQQPPQQQPQPQPAPQQQPQQPAPQQPAPQQPAPQQQPQPQQPAPQQPQPGSEAPPWQGGQPEPQQPPQQQPPQQEPPQ